MLTLRSLLVAVAVVGCSNTATAPATPSRTTQPDVRVVNATAEPLVFFAVAADLAPLLDPVPEASVTERWAQPLAPGAARRVGEIAGREQAPDGGVAVYLYALTADRTRARFTRVELASGQEIRQADGRIIIRRLRS
ncbi:MAG: hypothetical protein ACREOC_16280 [Gemmatimonadales bacterium]